MQSENTLKTSRDTHDPLLWGLWVGRLTTPVHQLRANCKLVTTPAYGECYLTNSSSKVESALWVSYNWGMVDLVWCMHDACSLNTADEVICNNWAFRPGNIWTFITFALLNDHLPVIFAKWMGVPKHREQPRTTENWETPRTTPRTSMKLLWTN